MVSISFDACALLHQVSHSSLWFMWFGLWSLISTSSRLERVSALVVLVYVHATCGQLKALGGPAHESNVEL